MAKAARKTVSSRTISEQEKASSGASGASSKKHNGPGPQKQYLKTEGCKVTFTLPAEAAPDAHQVMLVGEFNGWDESATPMKRLKDGRFQATVKLEPGRDYRFRYLIDGSRWENDWAADKYEPNEFMGDDSVITV